MNSILAASTKKALALASAFAYLSVFAFGKNFARFRV